MKEKNINVLLVEDNPDDACLIGEFLNSVKDARFDLKHVVRLKEALDYVNNDHFDVVLLDLGLPDDKGIGSFVSMNLHAPEMPIIVITALNNESIGLRAVRKGAQDYLVKGGFDNKLLWHAIRYSIERKKIEEALKKSEDELRMKNILLAERELHLSHIVEEKTNKIKKVMLALVNGLENANLYNDEDTGSHMKRVSEFSVLLAEKYGAEREFVDKIGIYASLHDVGKVGIPDALLKHTGIYTSEEYELMKQHVIVGFRILDNNEIDDMAKNIALYHHEKWDGTGYVNNLKGTDIPLEARIVAVADVYDALVNKRVYKRALGQKEADGIIRRESGKHFEPEIVDIYTQNKKRIENINNSLHQI